MAGGKRCPAWESVRADDRGRAGTGSVGKEETRRLLTKKTLAKKEKVFLAKKNVLILCS